MISHNKIIGLPIKVINTNKKISTVKDILFVPKTRNVIGIIVSKKRLIGLPKYIPLDQIDRITSTSVFVKSITSIRTVNRRDPLYKLFINNNTIQINDEVYYNNDESGAINDIIFDFEVGTIDSFIISDGIIEDLISGRKVLVNNDLKIIQNKIYLKNKL